MSTWYYLYGITDRPSVSQSNLATIKSGELYGVYEEVGEEFGDDQFRDNLQNQDWLISKAEKHQYTLDLLFRESPIIPIAFGSIFRDLSAMSDKIKSSSADHLDTLNLIKGKEEWCVKLFYEKDKLSEWAGSKHKDAESLRQQIADSSAGKAFLLKKELEELTKKIIKETLNQQRKEFYNKIKANATNLKLLENSKPELQQNKDTNILNMAILITGEETKAIEGIVQEYNDEHAISGLYSTITGPWPAYNFVKS
ncbi:MAG: GvpL/GvpF family gas vesicle protein [Ekhidna sp.]|nr:GvpL/GvpF family gas vesicle protein [Ekhidna sp.]